VSTRWRAHSLGPAALVVLSSLGCGGSGSVRAGPGDGGGGDTCSARESARGPDTAGFADADGDAARQDPVDALTELVADRALGPESGPPPHPTSTRCGDGIRDPVTEECDEGATADGEPCTADCRVRAVVLAPGGATPVDAGGGGATVQLGTAPHVAAASDSGFAVVHGLSGPIPAVELQLFGESGARLGPPLDVAADYSPLPAANAAVAGLPGGRYAVAWTDSMAGPPEIRVRVVDGQTLGPGRLVHDSVAGLHADPDVLWTGDRLIVAYTDLLDVTYRAFAADLTPLGPEAPVAATPAIESGVSLAPFASGWAAAVRSNSNALERVYIKSGDLAWSTPPALPGPAGDRPALVAIDDTRLLVVFSVGTDPGGTGTADVGRLMWAVASASAPGEIAVSPLDVGPPAAPATGASQRRPSATRVGDRIYLAWTSTAAGPSGDEQVLLATATADETAAGGVAFGAPMPLPRGDDASGWRRNLRLGASPLFPAGAVISTWESASDGSSLARVDLMLDLRPSSFVFLP